jgi:hypothetical protein
MGNLSEATLSEMQQEIVDLKIRVNNLEKKVSALKAPPKPKARHKFI